MKLFTGPTTTAVKISALNGGIKSLNHKKNWIYDEYMPNSWRDTEIMRIQEMINALEEMKAELDVDE